MKVHDFMNRKVITCHPHEKIANILNKLRLFHISGMPVREGNAIKGIVSEKDILNRIQAMTEDGSIGLEEAIKRADLLVGDVMVRDVVTVAPADAIDTVVNLMIKRNIKRIPVVVEGRIVGIVARGDIIRALAESG